MPHDSKAIVPRQYFLNERHQLVPTAREGGRQPQPVLGVNWQSRGDSLSKSLETFRTARRTSPDPSSRRRLFIVAKPPSGLAKSSTSQQAEEGKLESKVDLAGKDSQIIGRIGFDLLAVTKDGSAIVHATDERIEQMVQSLNRLGELGTRDKNRWAHVTRLFEIPAEYKTSLDWWGTPDKQDALEVIVDLQPFLTRPEVEQVIKAITSRLKDGEKLKRSGTEFTGRKWLAGAMRFKTIVDLAKNFQAIYSIHPPLVAVTTATKQRSRARSPSALKVLALQTVDGRTLPCVAVLDTGIPSDHICLGPYRRGEVIGEGTSGAIHDSHGSLVASRVVFGDVVCDDGLPSDDLVGACSIYDVNVGDGPGKIYPDAIDHAIGVVTASARDIRVFNLSFDSEEALDTYENSYRDAWLRRLADLDNRAFSEDLLFVVAAGNSGRGIRPSSPYPRHIDDPQWALRAWSRCFNALTCGGTADRPDPGDGVASEPGAPSPFTRIGPGFANSRKPDFSAHAGNCGPTYQYSPGTGQGVWCCNDSGLWEDHSGTSFAAPLLAREAARTFAFLQKRCDAGARPFAALVKAVLALNGRRPLDLSQPVKKLADKTVGFGAVRFEDIESANAGRAAFLWQGIIGSEDEVLTVELPLPGSWVESAESPVLRLISAWDTPVNPAAEHVWACRKVELTLRPAGGLDALRFKGRNASGYPLVERHYELDGDVRSELVNHDNCLLELKYSRQGMAEYPPGFLEFSPQQRVAIAYELYDESESAVSPHSAIQALPIAVQGTLNRLSTIVPAARHAISIRVPQ